MGYIDKDGRHIEAEFDLKWPCCRYKATGEIFEYFLYRDPVEKNNYDLPGKEDDGGTTLVETMYPEWYDDSLDLVDGDMVINHEGKGYVRGNKNNAADLETVGKDYEVVPSIDRMFQYMDHR